MSDILRPDVRVRTIEGETEISLGVDAGFASASELRQPATTLARAFRNRVIEVTTGMLENVGRERDELKRAALPWEVRKAEPSRFVRFALAATMAFNPMAYIGPITYLLTNEFTTRRKEETARSAQAAIGYTEHISPSVAN